MSHCRQAGDVVSPHRLGAQDEALSRPKLEFESPWGHQCPKALQMQGFCFEVKCMHAKNSSRGYLIGIFATVLLSFTGILISYLNKNYNLPSLVLAFWRDCFVVFALIVVFALFHRGRFRLDRSHLPFFVLYGLTLSLFNSMWTFSVQYNGAAVATVLAFSSPAMTAILAHFILKERINSVKMVSIGLSLLGTALVSGAVDPSAWKVNAAGILFGLLTGFFFACYNMMGKTSANKSIDPWTTMLYGFSNAIIFLFLFNLAINFLGGQSLLANFMWLGTSVSGWAILFFLGIGPTVGGFGLYLVSLNYLPATVANLIGALEPAFTAVWAYFLLSEQLTFIQIIGSLLVFASVILLRLGESQAGPEMVLE
jgi:drug/metabolite transporter (DMT)-like permease